MSELMHTSLTRLRAHVRRSILHSHSPQMLHYYNRACELVVRQLGFARWGSCGSSPGRRVAALSKRPTLLVGYARRRHCDYMYPHILVLKHGNARENFAERPGLRPHWSPDKLKTWRWTNGYISTTMCLLSQSHTTHKNQ